jgi:hypothetical protein
MAPLLTDSQENQVFHSIVIPGQAAATPRGEGNPFVADGD